VHIEEPGLFGEAVVVQFDDLDIAGAQRLNDLLHLGGGQDEVAVDRRPVAADGLEVDHCRQVQRIASS
jgi:hypothetical protein